MVTHMKTTVEVATELMCQFKKQARDEGMTFKALLEKVMWRYVQNPPKKRRRRMRDCSVPGGMQPGVDLADWASVRAVINADGRG